MYWVSGSYSHFEAVNAKFSFPRNITETFKSVSFSIRMEIKPLKAVCQMMVLCASEPSALIPKMTMDNDKWLSDC